MVLQEELKKRKEQTRSFNTALRVEVLNYAKDYGVTATTKKYGISSHTVYNWREKYKSAIHDITISPPLPDYSIVRASDNEAKVKALIEENRKLRTLVINQLLEKV